MRKIKLDLDALAVESFATDRTLPPRGTVLARSAPLTQQNQLAPQYEMPTEEPTDAETGLQPCSWGCATSFC